jgi:hypothetical protein
MPWAPLVDGDAATAALSAVRAIAIELADTRQPGVAVDRTLFWAYACEHLDEPFAYTAYDAALDDLVAELRAGAATPALHGGLAGIGWTLAHVLDDAEPLLSTVDEALLGALAGEAREHDLISGLVGIGVYFLERDTQAAHDGLAYVIGRLERAAVRSDDGLAWHTSPATLPTAYAQAWPDGFVDCGVAHGVPGAIAFLARAGAHRLCGEATRWLLAQRHGGYFPSRIAAGRPRTRARSAWCYGDPGIAVALYPADRGAALALAREAARRAPDDCGVRDASLCHGAAGLAHLYNRLAQATGDAELAAVARTWLERALAMRPVDPGAHLLDGTVGVGLALLAATTRTEPRWDRLLLC